MSKWDMTIQVSDKLTQWLSEHGGVKPEGQQEDILGKVQQDDMPEQNRKEPETEGSATGHADTITPTENGKDIVSAVDEQQQDASDQQNVTAAGNILDLPVNQYMNQKAAQNRQQQDDRMMKLYQEGKDVNWMDELERSSYEGAKHDVVVLRDKLQKMQQEMDRLQAELEQERDLRHEAIRVANEAKDAERIFRETIERVTNIRTAPPEDRLANFLRAAKVSSVDVYFEQGS